MVEIYVGTSQALLHMTQQQQDTWAQSTANISNGTHDIEEMIR